MKKAVFISTAIFFFGITLALFSCEKERDNVTTPVTSELSVADQAGQSTTAQEGVEDRSNTCPCDAGGCNGPADMTLNVIGKVGGSTVDLTVSRVCSPLLQSCFSIQNAVLGSTTTNPITYGVGPIPLPGGEQVKYRINAFFYSPTGKNFITVRVNAPGIVNRDITFSPAHTSFEVSPNVPACF